MAEDEKVATDTADAKPEPKTRAKRGERVATDTILLGQLGEIHAGQVVPTHYADSLGVEQDTDFDRLQALGLVE